MGGVTEVRLVNARSEEIDSAVRKYIFSKFQCIALRKKRTNVRFELKKKYIK